ncbi:MAG: hypothetical protein FWE74_11140 [Oscillospiraceae bacterium]|nr:hypothetical protein [Oscillospiraceae bacterium]
MRTRKSVSLFLAFAMIVSVIWFTPVIAEASTPDFEEFVTAELENFQSGINVGAYVQGNAQWLSAAQADFSSFFQNTLSVEYFRVMRNNPQLFHVMSEVKVMWNSSFSVVELEPAYSMSRTQYTEASRRFNAAAAEALAYAGNASNDFEKALFLHDYLVLNTVYDIENLRHIERIGFVGTPLNPHSHDAYGALVLGKAVCEGYAYAYVHLLRQVGVESRIITGYMGGVPHAWNIVKINGSWYHVDVTANDPVVGGEHDMHGFVSHEHFLISSARLNSFREANGNQTYTGWSLPAGISADSTNFDDAFFRDVETAIVKLGNYYYWIDSIPLTTGFNRGVDNNHIRSYNISNGRIETVHSFEAIWYLEGTEHSTSFRFDTGSYARIATHDGKLYFNTAKEIYSLDLATGEITLIHTPANLGGTDNRFIFGITISGNEILYSIKVRASWADNISRFTLSAASSGGTTPPVTTVVAFTTADALSVLRAATGLSTLSAADMTRLGLSGTVTTADALTILRAATGIN